MTSLTTLVAGFASSVEGTAVGGGAVSGDVTKLAAGVALHGLCLAIAGEVVGATTLVAGGWSGTTGKTSTAGETSVAATRDGPASTKTDTSGVRASSGQVTGLATVVAASISSGTAQAQSRAIGLDMS